MGLVVQGPLRSVGGGAQEERPPSLEVAGVVGHFVLCLFLKVVPYRDNN